MLPSISTIQYVWCATAYSNRVKIDTVFVQSWHNTPSKKIVDNYMWYKDIYPQCVLHMLPYIFLRQQLNLLMTNGIEEEEEKDKEEYEEEDDRVRGGKEDDNLPWGWLPPTLPPCRLYSNYDSGRKSGVVTYHSHRHYLNLSSSVMRHLSHLASINPLI